MVVNKLECCGCGACRDICPKKCIEMKQNEEGFSYPYVDKVKCVECKLCEKVCPINKEFAQAIAPSYYAGFNNSSTIMADSSSGGIFWPLAEYVLARNGVVYGAKVKDDLSICHDKGETLEQCEAFRKSKYLQSDTNSIYTTVKRDLETGRTVLFSGTPCQVAALYQFLGKKYEELITVDVVCHGVPSKLLFDRFLVETEHKYGKKITNYCWRDKSKGWGPNRIAITFEDGTIISSTSINNPIQKAFLENWCLRPSCYKCQFAKLPRVADMSLADFWGYSGPLVDENKNQGISLISVNSKIGEDIFENIKSKLEFHEVSEEYAKKSSRHLWLHPSANDKRELFMRDLVSGKSIAYLSKKYLYPSKLKRLASKISRVIRG